MPDPYYDGSESEAELYGRVAAGYVQDLAPVPDPEPSDYAELASSAEYLVYNYLASTKGGALSGRSRSGLSATYADMKRIKALIRPVMGEYYKGGKSGFRIVGIDRA